MGNIRSVRPPTGWTLVINVPDYGPEAFDIYAGADDIYESPEHTFDGITKVQGFWSAEEGFMISLTGNTDLPSPWAARKLAAMLWAIADEAES